MDIKEKESDEIDGQANKYRKKSLERGPHGVGDPKDQSLRKVERDILIPKKIREKIHEEKCRSELLDFLNCSKETGLLNIFKCRKENEIMKDCFKRWFHNKELNDQCKKEYLYERTYYREHGVPVEKMKKSLRFQ